MSALDFLRIVDADGDHIDVNHAKRLDERALMFTAVDKDTREAAAVALDETRVRELVAFAQGWLDAPRLAARTSAEVLAEDDGVRLLKTSAGEWGTEEQDEREGYPPGESPAPGGEISRETFGDGSVLVVRAGKRHWFETEELARASFAFLRDKALCETCSAEVDADDLAEAGEDGPMVCQACADALREEFKATTFVCVGGVTTVKGCGWRGEGADVQVDDDLILCPDCNNIAEEVVETTTEANPS